MKEKRKHKELSTASNIVIVLLSVLRVALILFIPTICTVFFLACQVTLSMQNGLVGPTGTSASIGFFFMWIVSPIVGLAVATISSSMFVFQKNVTEVSYISKWSLRYVIGGMLVPMIVGYMFLLG